MKTTKLTWVVIFIVFFSFSFISAEYLSTDIVKGFSWRYAQIENTDCPSSSTRIIDIVIDSVWGNPADTLFFQITEHDSVKETYINDTTYIQNNHILCRKANRVAQCNSIILSALFSDHENVNYDSLYLYSNSSFSHSVEIDLNNEQYTGLLLGDYRSGYGTHFGSTVDTLTFCNHLGLLRRRFIRHAVYQCESDSSTISLVSYNGKSISYSCGLKTTCNRKSSLCNLQAFYKIVVGRINLNSGFNLLGQVTPPIKSAYLLRIVR